MDIYKILFWILPISVLLHIIEEFIFPGGFMVWDRDYRPGISKNKHPRFLIIINVLLFAICFNPIMSGLNSGGIEWWLSIVSILFVNSYFHIKGVIVLKKYSPGVVGTAKLAAADVAFCSVTAAGLFGSAVQAKLTVCPSGSVVPLASNMHCPVCVRVEMEIRGAWSMFNVKRVAAECPVSPCASMA